MLNFSKYYDPHNPSSNLEKKVDMEVIFKNIIINRSSVIDVLSFDHRDISYMNQCKTIK